MIRSLVEVISGGTVLALVAVASVLFGRTSRVAKVVAMASASLLFALRIKSFGALLSSPFYYVDLEIFRISGQAILDGGNPYDPSRTVLPLNPPTALPLFVALTPVWMDRIWGLFNVIGGLGLAPLSWLALGGRREARMLPTRLELIVLAVVVGASDSAVTQNNLGQLAVVTALAILGSLALLNAGRPLSSGLAMAVATIKIGTMLPFALVAIDRRTINARWFAGVTIGVVVLSLAATKIDLLPSRCVDDLRNIRELSRPGRINDHSFAAFGSAWMVGTRHAFYRLGLIDNRILGAAEVFCVFTIGAVLTWAVWRGDLPKNSLYALITLYATIFLYHRLYDLVLLALPLTYAVGLARNGPPRSRMPAAASAVAMTLTLYLKAAGLRSLSDRWQTLSWPVRALVLPSATWLILGSLLMLALAVWHLRDTQAVHENLLKSNT